MATGVTRPPDSRSPSRTLRSRNVDQDQRIGPRRGKADNNRGPQGPSSVWLRVRGSHDVQSSLSTDAQQQDGYPDASESRYSQITISENAYLTEESIPDYYVQAASPRTPQSKRPPCTRQSGRDGAPTGLRAT